MSYSSIVEMSLSQTLAARIAACVADEGFVGDPTAWVREHVWAVVASDSGWAAAWDSARASGSDNVNPDTGARDDVITDGMILAVVQPMLAELTP